MEMTTVFGLMLIAFLLGRWSVAKPPVVENAKTEVYLFRVEVHNGVSFGYDRDTNRFLGQHEDVEELTQIVTKKVPGHRFYIALGGGDDESV